MAISGNDVQCCMLVQSCTGLRGTCTSLPLVGLPFGLRSLLIIDGVLLRIDIGNCTDVATIWNIVRIHILQLITARAALFELAISR